MTISSLPETATAHTDRRGWAALLQRLRHLEPSSLLWIVLIAILIFLVVSPMVRLFIASLEAKGTGALTIANYITAYSRERYIDALLNSLALGAGTAVLSVVIAVPMAWAVSRTDMPGKRFAWLVVLGAFIVPPYLGAIGWILLAGPNSGWMNQAWTWITGAEDGIFNVYSFPGLVIIIALNAFPFVFIFTKAALDLVSSEMEDAANILGAGTLTTTFKVTLPLVWPAILARFNVVTTQLWQFFVYPLQVGVASAYAMPLLLVTVALIWVQKLVLARKGFVSQTGKGGERRMIELGPMRWVLFGYCFFIGLCAVLLPMIVLIQASFSKAWGRGLTLDNLTLHNYAYLLFDHDMAQQSIINTFIYAIGAACFAALLALC